MEEELDEYTKYWLNEYISILHEVWTKMHDKGVVNRKINMKGNGNALKNRKLAPNPHSNNFKNKTVY